MPRVSAVIPAYNGERFLAQTIESVLAQTMREWELVIVDDGSSDGTLSLAQRYGMRDARIRVVRQANRGVAAARNRGLQETDVSSEYVTFLDQDDVWEHDALESLIAALAASPQCVGAHGLSHTIDAAGIVFENSWLERFQRDRRGIVGTAPVGWLEEQPTTFAVLALMNVIPTPGQVLIRRQALAAAGPFDGMMAPADDWDMWLRLTSRGDMAFVCQTVLRYRVHDSNASLQREAMNRARMRIVRKYCASRELSEAQRHLMRTGYCWSQWVTCTLRWHWAKDCAAQRQWRGAAVHLRRLCTDFVRFGLSFVRHSLDFAR